MGAQELDKVVPDEEIVAFGRYRQTAGRDGSKGGRREIHQRVKRGALQPDILALIQRCAIDRLQRVFGDDRFALTFGQCAVAPSSKRERPRRRPAYRRHRR